MRDKSYALTVTDKVYGEDMAMPVEAALLIEHVVDLCADFRAELEARGGMSPLLRGMLHELVMHAYSMPSAIVDGSFEGEDRKAARATIEKDRTEFDVLAEQHYAEHMTSVAINKASKRPRKPQA